MHPMQIHHVPIVCIKQAAAKYHIPPKVLAAVIETEGGRNHEATKNKNGTYDYGIMQINSVWLSSLARLGYSKHDLLNNTCKNVNAGAMILKNNIAEAGSLWAGVGDYNSHNPYYNRIYRRTVLRHYQHINIA
jgi:soluble lytic murein transglycosylase-like protein